MATIYGDVTGFQLYHEERNRELSPELLADDEAVQAALVVASEWIDSRFRSKFPGMKTGGRSQEREWPRKLAYDIHGEFIGDEIPREIIHATYEAAAIAGTTPGALSANWTPNKYASVSISGVVSVTYGAIGSVEEAQTQFGIVNDILSNLFALKDPVPGYVGSSVRG